MPRPPNLQAVSPPVDLDAVATIVGQDWAKSRVRELLAADRVVAGGWPGTLREAKGQLLAALGRQGLTVPAVDVLDTLARTATAAARVCWGRHAEPDLET